MFATGSRICSLRELYEFKPGNAVTIAAATFYAKVKARHPGYTKRCMNYRRLPRWRIGMNSDVNFAIEWTHTGRRPGNKRGVERRAAYLRGKLMDPVRMQSFVSGNNAGRPRRPVVPFDRSGARVCAETGGLLLLRGDHGHPIQEQRQRGGLRTMCAEVNIGGCDEQLIPNGVGCFWCCLLANLDFIHYVIKKGGKNVEAKLRLNTIVPAIFT